MTDKKSGFFWHVHHETLVEWCHDYKERVDYIRQKKSRREVPIRLRLMQPVKGTLPKPVVETERNLERVREAYYKARRGRDDAAHLLETTRSGMRSAFEAYDRALEAYKAAERTYSTAEYVHRGTVRRYMPAIEALHKKECRNCPWDGSTIFPAS